MPSLIYRYINPIAYCALVFTSILLLLPGSVVEQSVLWIYQWWPWPSSGLMSDGILTDKIVHLMLFATCGFFFCIEWIKKNRSSILLFALLLGYGMTIELLQILIPGRGASLGDLAANGVGAALGMLLANQFSMKLLRISSGRD